MRIKSTQYIGYVVVVCILACILQPLAWSNSRLKDIVNIQGVRSNQLVGYGLVVGLDGTGDKSSAFTEQSFRTMIRQFGITLPANRSIDIKNVAAVAISADLPAFSLPGQKIDVTVSSIGSAKSLRGGMLLMAPLKGIDGEIYAIAQGSVVVSGFGAEGADGSKISVNQTSVGKIPNGASIERTIQSPFQDAREITLTLDRPDFTTSKRITTAINKTFGPQTAHSIDANSIQVTVPIDPNKRVDFMSALENINVDPDFSRAKVVVNSRTGTIVMGEHVLVKAAAVSHGSLTVTITEDPSVSQPNPLSKGETQVVPSSNIQIKQENKKMFLFKGGATLNELVSAVNSVGASPGDLMAILEALKQAGALDAELVVI